MIQALAIVVLLLASTGASAQQATGQPPVFDATRCAEEHTSTMCIVKAVWATRETEAVVPRTAVYGSSRQYYVVAGTGNWLREVGASQSDLLFVDDTANAIIEFTWLGGQQGDFDAVARAELAWLTDATNAEPDRYEINWEPFKSRGAVYRSCYTTNRATSECQYSAAVNLPGGTVKVLSILSSDAALAQQVLDTIASLAVAEPADRKTQGDVLRMPTLDE